jgi:hypothetical protein
VTSAAEQLQLALGPFQNRALFSTHFLRRRLPEWPEFRDLDPMPLLNSLRTRIAACEERTPAEIVDVLVKNRSRLRAEPASRTTHDAVRAAHETAGSRLGELRLAMERGRREAEERVADLYELSEAQRRLIREDSRSRS